MKSRTTKKKGARLKRKKQPGKKRFRKKVLRRNLKRRSKIKGKRKRKTLKGRSTKRRRSTRRKIGKKKRRPSPMGIPPDPAPIASRDDLVPGDRYNHIFAFETAGAPEVWVDPAVWDRIVANLPQGYQIPDREFADLIYPGLFK